MINPFEMKPPKAVKAWQRSQSTAPVGDSSDLQRILALPRRLPPDVLTSEALISIQTEKFARKHAPPCECAARGRDCITTLRRSQAWGLYELGEAKGVLGQIGVGHGKSLLGLLAPIALGLVEGEVAVLLCPPSNIDEIISDYELAGAHFQMPSISCFGTRDYTVVQQGQPSLYLVPYSKISRPEFSGWMDSVAPRAIIADECDKLRHLDTATTVSRVANCFAQRPNTYFAGWTGSLSDKGLLDFYHLLIWALRFNSPLPLNKEVVQDWGRALNPSSDPADPGALRALCADGETIGQGFQRRLSQTMGFIVTTESSIPQPMIVRERVAPAIPDVIQAALNELREKGARPDEEVLTDKLQIATCAKQISCGFYYKWIYPKGEPRELVEEWFEARKAWNSEVRYKLTNKTTGMDSDKLCTDAAKRAHGDLDDAGPVWKAAKWERWREVMNLVEPKTKSVRLHDFLARDAAEWALKYIGIVWYEHREFGKWVSELSGLPQHSGGTGARELILAETGARSIIASIKSHGRGRDGLQYAFSNQLITSFPASGGIAEQLLGRLHRPGQKAPNVFAQYYGHTLEMQKSFCNAILSAEYTADRLGTAQKLIHGEK